MQQAYFSKHCLPLLGPSKVRWLRLNLFNTVAANDQSLTLIQYMSQKKLPWTFGTQCRFLMVKDKYTFISTKWHTKLPGIIGQNRIQLLYKEFKNRYHDSKSISITVFQVLTRCFFLSFVCTITKKWENWQSLRYKTKDRSILNL